MAILVSIELLTLLISTSYLTINCPIPHWQVIETTEMYQSDFVQILRQKPFQPFRIHVSDGSVYDINHPEFVLVSPSTAFVHFPADDLPPPAVNTKYEIVSLSHIVRIVPKESKSPTNGSSTN